MTLASTSWKEATDTTSGDSTKYGVPDGLLLYAQLFNGDLNIDNVDINSPLFIRTGKLQLQNTANTYGFLIDSSAAIVADRTVSFPLMVGDGTFVIDDMIQTISSKKIGNWLDSVESAAPSSPASSEHRFYVDSTSNQFTTKNNAGTVQEFITDSATQTMTNKTLTTPTINVLDNALFIKDSADNTKIAVFELSGLTTATTRTYTLPDADTTLGGGDAVTSNGLDQFAATTSAELAGVLSDETGSGLAVFATSPTFTTPLLGTPTSGTLTNCTGLPITGITSSTSAEFATLCSDETGSGSLVFATSPTLVTPVLGTPASGALVNCNQYPEAIGIACGDETTVTAVATGVTEFQMPYAFTLTDVRATVTTAPTTDAGFTVDINEGGSTILSTKITIDAGQKTSATAATPPVISDSSLADSGVITVDVDAASTGATEAGLKIWLIGYQT
jgi:hypothetical protein